MWIKTKDQYAKCMHSYIPFLLWTVYRCNLSMRLSIFLPRKSWCVEDLADTEKRMELQYIVDLPLASIFSIHVTPRATIRITNIWSVNAAYFQQIICTRRKISQTVLNSTELDKRYQTIRCVKIDYYICIQRIKIYILIKITSKVIFKVPFLWVNFVFIKF